MSTPHTPNSDPDASGGTPKPPSTPDTTSSEDGYEVVGGLGGTLSKESVLSGFDPDKDFDKDIAAAEKAKSASASPKFERPRPKRQPDTDDSNVADVEEADAMPVDGMPLPLIKPPMKAGLDAPKVLFAAGGVIIVIAMVLSGWTAKSQNFAVAILTGYQTILHTITGVVALVVISLLHSRPVGSYEQGASRLFVAIGLFQLIMGMEFGLLSGKGEEFAMAAVIYALAMMALFRMRMKTILEIIAIHLIIIAVMWLGTQLAIAAVPTVKK